MTALRKGVGIRAAQAKSGVIGVRREQRLGLNGLRVLLWTAGLGWVLYGIGMFVDGPFERLRSPMPPARDPGRQHMVATMEPLRSDGVAVPVYFPAQYLAEERRAPRVDPIESF